MQQKVNTSLRHKWSHQLSWCFLLHSQRWTWTGHIGTNHWMRGLVEVWRSFWLTLMHIDHNLVCALILFAPNVWSHQNENHQRSAVASRRQTSAISPKLSTHVNARDQSECLEKVRNTLQTVEDSKSYAPQIQWRSVRWSYIRPSGANISETSVDH